MRIINTSCRRGRRGVSTILGTIIFIAILFTAVIPMQLVMKQADGIYERKVLEMKHRDDERDREDIEIWVYPSETDSSDNITVEVHNKCEVNVRILRVWINDTAHPVDPDNAMLQPMEEVVLGEYTVNAKEGSKYDVRVATGHGNSYESETGILAYTGSEWETEWFGINVVITWRADWMKPIWTKYFNVSIKHYPEEEPPFFINPGGTIIVRAVSASEQFFDVPEQGIYEINCSVKLKPAADDIWEQYYSQNSTIEWPNGPPIIHITIENPPPP